jgi:hypothetical protein
MFSSAEYKFLINFYGNGYLEKKATVHVVNSLETDNFKEKFEQLFQTITKEFNGNVTKKCLFIF